MDYIIRNKSLITGKENLEHLYTFKDYPVFFWCVDSPIDNDLIADMSWGICPETWVIQIDKLIPLDILYQSQHVDWVWKVWNDYYSEFANYININAEWNLLEIWWWMWKLAIEVLKDNKVDDYTIIEPNPLINEKDRLSIIKWFFNWDTKIDKKINTVVFSQVLEHIYEPTKFIDNIFTFLDKWEKLIFAYPNLKLWLEKSYTNAINFEHCMFLTDFFVDVILKRSGFKILDKTFYNEHSIFYTCYKDKKDNNIQYENKYNEYKTIFKDYIEYYNKMIEKLNSKISWFDGNIYLFWWHIFSQHLISCWLNKDKITCILDNSDLKNWKRLYWTPFKVEKPEIIRWKNKVAVILKAAIYQDEIRKQLLEINPNVEIWE